MARLPAIGYNDKGHPIYPEPLGYFPNWDDAYQCLINYHASHKTVHDGSIPTAPISLPNDLSTQSFYNTSNIVQAQTFIYYVPHETPSPSPIVDAPLVLPCNSGPTFAEVFEKFWNFKYVDTIDVYDDSSLRCTMAAYKNSKVLHDREFKSIKYDDMQKVLDECPLKYASLEHIKRLFREMYAYAISHDIEIIQDYSRYLKIKKKDDDEKGIPFSLEELEILWKNRELPFVDTILILCYSGFRIEAMVNITVDLSERTFFGGVKTDAAKCRTVPIHSAIFDMVKNRMELDGKVIPNKTAAGYRKDFYATLNVLGIPGTEAKHTPHDCRATFATMLSKAKADPYMIKRLMGHSLSDDVTQDRYISKTIDDFRETIELIKVNPEWLINR